MRLNAAVLASPAKDNICCHRLSTTDPRSLTRHHGTYPRNTDTTQVASQEEEAYTLRLVLPPGAPLSTRLVPAPTAVVVIAMARIARAVDGGVAVPMGSWSRPLLGYGTLRELCCGRELRELDADYLLGL